MILLLGLNISLVCASNDTNSLYDKLDALLLRRNEFCIKKEERIDSLRNLKNDGMNSMELFVLYNKIFDEYFTYRSDSAYYYLSLAEDIASHTNSNVFTDRCKINRSFLLATTGNFAQSLDVLNRIERNKIDKSMLFDYYSAYEWVYSVWSEYSADDAFSINFKKKEMEYNDSMLMVLEPSSNEFLYWNGELLARKGDQLEAQKSYEKALENLEVETRLSACVTCGFAFAHKGKAI